MVFPISDDNSDRQILPVINVILIVINVAVFALCQRWGENNDFTYAYACVPYEILTGDDLKPGDVFRNPETGQMETNEILRVSPHPVYWTLLTSIFMHGSLMHLLGNMWFLWIFGDNVENDLGHARYLAFYLLAGLLASLAHVFVSANSLNAFIPSLGASGAISGVLGGYILQHPTRRVTVILFRFLTDVPAYVAIGIWFAFQLIEGLGAFGSSGGGVAYAAHVGGFIAGLALMKPFLLGRPAAHYYGGPSNSYRPDDQNW